MLSCRICEATQPLAPASSCPDCSGPLDVRYVWEPSRGLLDDPHSLWNYGALLPHRETALPSRTPLVPAPRISAALDIDVHLKLETANPTHSFKDRMAASAVAAAQGFGIETLFCASTGNLGAAIAAGCAAAGLEAVILNPADAARADAPFRDLRRDRLHGARDARGLPAPGARPRAPLPVGVPRRQSAPVRGRGDQDDRVRDRGAAELGDAGRGRQPGCVRGALREARPGLRRARRARARGRQAAADVRRPARRLPAGRRGLGRRASAVPGDAEHDRPLAGRRRPELRRARDRRRAHVGRLDHAPCRRS